MEFMLDFSRVYITNIVGDGTNCFYSCVVSRFAICMNLYLNYYKRDFLWLDLALYMLHKNNHV